MRYTGPTWIGAHRHIAAGLAAGLASGVTREDGPRHRHYANGNVSSGEYHFHSPDVYVPRVRPMILHGHTMTPDPDAPFRIRTRLWCGVAEASSTNNPDHVTCLRCRATKKWAEIKALWEGATPSPDADPGLSPSAR